VKHATPSPEPFAEIAIVIATGTLDLASLPSVLEALKPRRRASAATR
jgi:hypothetical protein